MEIFTFKAKCLKCEKFFACPELSDFSYGDAVFFGANGNSYAYFNAVGNPITELVQKFKPAKTSLFSVCAQIADPVKGQFFTTVRVCPFCQSREMESWNGEKVSSIQIKEASFEGFLALTESEQ